MRSTFLFLVSLPLAAQQLQLAPPTPSVKARGEATERAEPNHAEIDIGVVTQAKTAEAASEANARQADAIVKALKAIVASAGNIRTVNYSVNPNYEYPKGGGTPSITGYTVNNTVRVDLDDLKLVQKVIDESSRAGANQINRLDFSLKDEQPVRTKALEKAVRQAKASAEAMVAGLGIKLGKVMEIDQQLQGGGPIPIRAEMMMAKSAAAPRPDTPIAAGEVEIQATVNVTFALIQ